MQKDIGMSDVQWSAGISLFYAGYAVGQLPVTVLAAKHSPRIILPVVMLGWSCVTIAMPAIKRPWGFLLCRFLVGLTEGPLFPILTLITSSWYSKSESPLRMAVWHSGAILSNVVSGLLAAGILTTMNGVADMRAWQWFLLLEGAVSILIAITGFWLLPNYPDNTGTYFMSETESEMAQYRVLVSAGGQSEDDDGDAWSGVWMACKEPYTWLFTGMHFSLILAQSFKDFFPSIVQTLGFSELGTYLIQAPPYIFAYGFTLLVSWSSGRRLEHCWHIVGAISLTLAGAIIMISTLNVGVRYFSMFLLVSGPFLGLSIQLSWETTVVPRPRCKRAALIAIANCLSNTTHWFTPYFFLQSQKPRYQVGGGCIIFGCIFTILFCIGAKLWSAKKNRNLVEEEERTGITNTWRFAS
jgi:MFS family permease